MWSLLTIQKPKNNYITTTNINNKNILITSIDDKLFAAADICPHEGIKLSLGCVKNNKIKCSLHGFSFDLTTGKCDNKNTEKLILYPIKEENNKIWIQTN